MVISSEGYFYSYNIDLENGGECSLMKQYRYVAFYPLLCVHNELLICLRVSCSLLDSGEENSGMTE